MSVISATAMFPCQRAYIMRGYFSPIFIKYFIRPSDSNAVLRFFEWMLRTEDFEISVKAEDDDIERKFHYDRAFEKPNVGFIMWVAMKDGVRANHFVDGSFCHSLQPIEDRDQGVLMRTGDFSLHAECTCHSDPSQGYQSNMGFTFYSPKGKTIDYFIETYSSRLYALSNQFCSFVKK